MELSHTLTNVLEMRYKWLVATRQLPTLDFKAEDPPLNRGLVLVDGIDGSIVEMYVEENPEDWIRTTGLQPNGEGPFDV